MYPFLPPKLADGFGRKVSLPAKCKLDTPQFRFLRTNYGFGNNLFLIIHNISYNINFLIYPIFFSLQRIPLSTFPYYFDYMLQHSDYITCLEMISPCKHLYSSMVCVYLADFNLLEQHKFLPAHMLHQDFLHSFLPNKYDFN